MVEKAKRSYHDKHIDTEELCRKNLTAKAGMVARLFCCIAVHDRDIGVSKDIPYKWVFKNNPKQD